MAACTLIFLICLLQTGFVLNRNQTAMDSHQVVPDVIDVAPTNIITVRFHQILFNTAFLICML